MLITCPRSKNSGQTYGNNNYPCGLRRPHIMAGGNLKSARVNKHSKLESPLSTSSNFDGVTKYNINIQICTSTRALKSMTLMFTWKWLMYFLSRTANQFPTLKRSTLVVVSKRKYKEAIRLQTSPNLATSFQKIQWLLQANQSWFGTLAWYGKIFGEQAELSSLKNQRGERNTYNNFYWRWCRIEPLIRLWCTMLIMKSWTAATWAVKSTYV